MDRAHSVARHAAAAGIHVVSGGALGIDGAAHRGALDGGGTTTIVLGSGADVLYPSRHARMFHRIVDAGAGALVSLLDDGTQPRSFTFVQRNPLISALADVVLVVEADVKSGSMSTAAAARHVGMSPLHFAHRFRAVARTSPMRCLKQLRLRDARTLLLAEGLRVSEVAARVGYESASHFTRDFKTYFGATPADYLRRFRSAGSGERSAALDVVKVTDAN